MVFVMSQCHFLSSYLFRCNSIRLNFVMIKKNENQILVFSVDLLLERGHALQLPV